METYQSTVVTMETDQSTSRFYSKRGNTSLHQNSAVITWADQPTVEIMLSPWKQSSLL